MKRQFICNGPGCTKKFGLTRRETVTGLQFCSNPCKRAYTTMRTKAVVTLLRTFLRIPTSGSNASD